MRCTNALTKLVFPAPEGALTTYKVPLFTDFYLLQGKIEKNTSLQKRRLKKMVARAGFEPTTFGLCLLLQFSLPDLFQFVVWTFSSPST